MAARRLAVPSSLSAAAFSAALFFGSIAFAQGDGAPASFGFATNAVRSAMTRFAPEAEAPPDAAFSPPKSFDQKVAAYAGALVEDALYRANADLASLASASGFEPEAVLDGDWKVVANTKKIPYRAVCQIDITWTDTDAFGEPIVTSGTAAFISPRILLTSARNVYQDALGGYADFVQIYPGRKGSTRPYGTQTDSTLLVHVSWANEEAPENDIGWIVLADHTLYDRVDYAFDYRVPSDSQLEKWNLNSLSYPRPYIDGVKQYQDFETQNQIVAAGRFRHYHDSQAESRGGPLYYQRNPAAARQIVGVLSDIPATGTTNWACRMSDSREDFTDSLIDMFP